LGAKGVEIGGYISLNTGREVDWREDSKSSIEDIRRANDTRWNSTYFELLDLLGLRIAFEAFIREERIEAEATKRAPKSNWPDEEDHARNAILKDKLEGED
jgi:hypothetical protein